MFGYEKYGIPVAIAVSVLTSLLTSVIAVHFLS